MSKDYASILILIVEKLWYELIKLFLLLSRLQTIFFPRFEFTLKTADLAARQHASSFFKGNS